MKLYILTNNWTTPHDDGVEVLGVYSDFEKAREIMQAEAEKIRAEYDEDFWDDDMSCEEPNEIRLGHCARDYLELDTVYSWEISEQDIE